MLIIVCIAFTVSSLLWIEKLEDKEEHIKQLEARLEVYETNLPHCSY